MEVDGDQGGQKQRGQGNRKPQMTTVKLKQVTSYLSIRAEKGPEGLRLKHGTLVGAAKTFGISRQWAAKLWKAAKARYEQDGILSLSPQKRQH